MYELTINMFSESIHGEATSFTLPEAEATKLFDFLVDNNIPNICYVSVSAIEPVRKRVLWALSRYHLSNFVLTRDDPNF